MKKFPLVCIAVFGAILAIALIRAEMPLHAIVFIGGLIWLLLLVKGSKTQEKGGAPCCWNCESLGGFFPSHCKKDGSEVHHPKNACCGGWERLK